MRIIELRVKIVKDTEATKEEVEELAEYLKDNLYDSDSSFLIEDITYEIKDDE